MTLRSREQDRMWHAVQAVKAVSDNEIEAYARYAQNLPSMLQGLGLGGTIAFLSVKSDGQHLGRDLASWLLSGDAHVPWKPEITGHQKVNEAADVTERLERIIGFSEGPLETSIIVYRQAAQEARHYAGWLKRLSKAKDDARRHAADAGAVPPQANGAGGVAVAATPANGAP